MHPLGGAHDPTVREDHPSRNEAVTRDPELPYLKAEAPARDIAALAHGGACARDYLPVVGLERGQRVDALHPGAEPHRVVADRDTVQPGDVEDHALAGGPAGQAVAATAGVYRDVVVTGELDGRTHVPGSLAVDDSLRFYGVELHQNALLGIGVSLVGGQHHISLQMPAQLPPLTFTSIYRPH